MPAADPIHAAELDAKILALKTEGRSFRAISRELNYDVGYVYRCFQRGVRTIRETAADDYKSNQLARIEAERAIVEEILHTRHLTVSNGHIVSDIVGNYPQTTEGGAPHPNAGDPIYGDPLVDDGPVLAAIDRMIKLDAQESDLLGLKAPTRVEQSGGVRVEIIGVDPAELL